MAESLFREIEHTADLGIEVEADTAGELFRCAGLALFSLMVSPEGVNACEEREETVQADGVAVGALVRLRPGERVALDGKVVRGQSALDQAPITGESVPVDKAEGDALYAGSINQSGELEYTVTAPASDSTSSPQA